MNRANDTMARILFPVVIGVGCMIVALTAADVIATMAHSAPNVGDIVAFAPAIGAPDTGTPETGTPATGGRIDDGVRLIVHRPDWFGCALDLSMLRQSGGSLVVEAQMTDTPGSFRVHWAGGRTSADGANCGDQADLIVDGRALDVLASSAGGYGTGQKRMPLFVSAAGV